MFGLEEIKNTLGLLSVGVLIDIVIAVVAIYLIYKRIRNKIFDSYKDKSEKDDTLSKALEEIEATKVYNDKILDLQNEVKENNTTLINICNEINSNIDKNNKNINSRLDRLEDRERNAIRSKILDMYRLFTSNKLNPLQAWTEMERDAFNELIGDYESLKGNGHVHTVVIPEINLLKVIPMTDLKGLTELFRSREL